MADIGNVYVYGPAGGSVNREDVMNAIINIDPFDTPLLNMAPKVPIGHTTVEWLQHSLPATSTAGRVEGQTFAADTITAPSRTTNVTQIFGAHVVVSETQQAVSPYGFTDTFMYETMRQTKNVMRSIEVRLFAASGASASGAGVTATAAGTARVMKSLQDFMTGTADGAWNAGDALIGGSGTTGSAQTLTDRNVSAVLQRIYVNGGNPNFMFVSPAVKRQVSAFTGSIAGAPSIVGNALTLNLNATDQQITRSINALLTDFGLINVVLDRWVPQETISATAKTGAHDLGNAFLLELPKVQVGYLRPIRFKRLAEDGDRVRGMVVGELTLKYLANRSGGRIFNITNLI